MDRPLPRTALLRPREVVVPRYLEEHYTWAYGSDRAVSIFERPWLINSILWGQYGRLAEAALKSFGDRLPGHSLQVGCAYGDLTARWLGRHDAAATLDVLDVLPVQLDNLARKLGPQARLRLLHADSAAPTALPGHYDRALVFFLLHEQPAAVREATIRETLRALKPGGKAVFVDYHRPALWHPLHLPMRLVLDALEPYARDLWRQPLTDWVPAAIPRDHLRHTTAFGGLYQRLEITVPLSP